MPEVAFRHWLVVLGREVDLLPLLQIPKRVVLVGSDTMVLIRLVPGIVDGRHYPVAARKLGEHTDLPREAVCFRHQEHLLDDLLPAIRDLLQNRNVVSEDGLFLPLVWLPDKGFVRLLQQPASVPAAVVVALRMVIVVSVGSEIVVKW
jgi:hypothetical protein